MRTLRLLLVLVASVCAIIACEKTRSIPAAASITIVHAMAGGNPIVPKFGTDTSGRYYKGPSTGSTMVKINYGAVQLYTQLAGAVPLKVVPSTDTMFNIFNGSVSLSPYGVYSFFLSGDTAHADTLLVKDNIPYLTDSSVGVRFANLSIGGKSLAISLSSDPAHTPIATLGYRQCTNFMKYAATASVGPNYKFQVRDQATGDSLTSYTWTFSRFKSHTIVIAGSTDPASTGVFKLKLFPVNNF